MTWGVENIDRNGIFVELSSGDGIKNVMWQWIYYFFHTHAHMDTLDSLNNN